MPDRSQFFEQLKTSRIKDMLRGILSPEDSIVEPLPEGSKFNAVDVLNSYLDSYDSNEFIFEEVQPNATDALLDDDSTWPIVEDIQ